jgi:hypothetical protein
MNDEGKQLAAKQRCPHTPLLLLMRMATNLVRIVGNVGIQIHGIAGRLNAFIVFETAGQVDILEVACGKESTGQWAKIAEIFSPNLFYGTHLKCEVKVKGLVLLRSVDYIYSPLRKYVAIIGSIHAPVTRCGVPQKIR